MSSQRTVAPKHSAWGLRQEALREIPEKMLKRLHKTLSHMHFAGLVGLSTVEQIGAFRQDLADALDRLRAVLPQQVE